MDAHAVLHRTRIPTMHFQDSLPRLPLPALQDTLFSMLYSAEPLCTREEIDEVNRLVADFAVRTGPELQAELEHRDRTQRLDAKNAGVVQEEAGFVEELPGRRLGMRTRAA